VLRPSECPATVAAGGGTGVLAVVPGRTRAAPPSAAGEKWNPNISAITRDQVESYAARKQRPRAEVKRWLAPSLASEAE
jgi:hypothetical protein